MKVLGGFGSNTATLLGVYAPGTEPYFFPNGFGLRLQKNAKVLIQIHYPAGTAGKQDKTSVRFTFNKDISVREVKIDALLDHGNMVDGPLIIPANQKKTFHQRYIVLANASLFAVMPHMHLVGKSTKVIGITPAKDTINIVNIPAWDFNWQMAYTFKTLQKVPKGTIVYSEVMYDNTSDNPNNPSDPPRIVTIGESTTNEMMLTFFYYTLYKAGDEQISLENTGIATGIQEQYTMCDYSIVNHHIVYKGNNPEELRSIDIYDVNGRSIYHKENAEGTIIEFPDLISSFYIVSIKEMNGKQITIPYCK